jgi:hypothetical protein
MMRLKDKIFYDKIKKDKKVNVKFITVIRFYFSGLDWWYTIQTINLRTISVHKRKS